MTEIRIRSGDTLRLLITVTDDSGAPVDLSAATLSCLVRAADDTTVAQVTLTATDAEGVVTIQADTTLWPLGRLRSDVKVISAGIVEHTETFPIYVSRSVTP